MPTKLPVLARIALPVALDRPLYYRVPEPLAGLLRPGHRVRVPLRGRTSPGFVLDLLSEAELPAEVAAVPLKEIADLDPEQVLLSRAMLDLARWIADYYVAPLGIVLESAVPRAVARPPRPLREQARAGVLRASSADSGMAAGLKVTAGHEPVFQPNLAQQVAVERISAALETRASRTFLLEGVTGSGKTEVYLRATRAALALDRSVLFLVPEIALGTQIVRWVRERFGDLVAEYHSQLTPGDRRAAWWRAFRGEARVMVGARSAVFAPMRDLGLVIVDEEHEPSYKQGECPRYHDRDTALMRARLEQAVAVLGSATPALESSRNAAAGKYELLLLPERVDGRPRATVTLVDLRAMPEGGGGSHGPAEPAGAQHAAAPLPAAPLPAAPLPAAPLPAGVPLRVVPGGERDVRDPLSPWLVGRLRAAMEAGDQAILFLNRRGFSTSVQCRACGHVYQCPSCSVTLTHHRAEDLLRCHYCNHTLRRVDLCPGCGGTDFAYTGFGTQRVEASLAQHLPGSRVLRMDLDSTRKRGSLAAMVAAFEAGEADILLGTQMVAKGFDFPRVTLVGVINADREMGLPDFRGQERAFQLLTQVAGRAGRGRKAGEVVFQTYLPDHHVIYAAGRQDYALFAERESEERRALGYPPHGRMANLLFDGADEAAVIRRAQTEADRLAGTPGVALLGPAPMPLSRLKGQYRWHLTLLSSSARALAQALRGVALGAVAGRSAGRVRLQIDMDPVSML